MLEGAAKIFSGTPHSSHIKEKLSACEARWPPVSTSQFEGRPRSLNPPYFTKLPASSVGWKVQSLVCVSQSTACQSTACLTAQIFYTYCPRMVHKEWELFPSPLAALNPHILPMGWVPAFDTVPIAMYKHCEHSADVGVFLPLMEDAAIICCICGRNGGIYSIDQPFTSALLAGLLGLCSGYYRTFLRKLKINILWNSVFCVSLVLSWWPVTPVAKHTVGCRPKFLKGSHDILWNCRDLTEWLLSW